MKEKGGEREKERERGDCWGKRENEERSEREVRGRGRRGDII